MQTDFTITDMRRFAGEAWGQLGLDIVQRWADFNAAYFGGKLRPIPIVLTHTQPFGSRLAFCSGHVHGRRTITLNVPDGKYEDRSYALLADNAVLLHEMVHQFLFERNEDPSHKGEPWCREIMRLTKMITGRQIWAGRHKTLWVDGRAVKGNTPHPVTGETSIPQNKIACWPRGQFELGALGKDDPFSPNNAPAASAASPEPLPIGLMQS